ncbi:MAG: KTSC domain-containing protein [Pyrinomonadaceae bacterium]
MAEINTEGLTRVEGSSVVAAHGYDPASKTLILHFNGGAIHEYDNFEPEKYEELKAADSVGKYLNANVIRGQYASRYVNK